MDIARPEFKRQKRRRQAIALTVVVLAVVAASIGVSRLKPASPEVERGTVWTDTVKRGDMLRQVRGLGSLIPSQEFTRQNYFWKGATRVPVKVGRASVNSIQVLEGLHEGDTVILSDMSRWDNTRIRLD